MEENSKKVFSKIGANYLILGVVAIIAQLILSPIIYQIYPELFNNVDYITIYGSICTYIIPLPIFWYLMKKIESVDIPKNNLNVKTFLAYLCVTFFLMYIGNIIGLVITSSIGGIQETEIVNPVEELISNSNIWINIILISFIAPIFEELFFRKFLVDKTLKYGIGISVFISALLFGLFHANLNQFFYAFLMGGFFAYIYAQTGKIIYPIAMHMIVNFSGSVMSLFVQTAVDSMTNTTAIVSPGVMFVFIYVLLMLAVILIGLVYLIKKGGVIKMLVKSFRNPLKDSILNVGMILFILFYIVNILMSLGLIQI